MVYYYCNRDSSGPTNIEIVMRCLIRQLAYKQGKGIDQTLIDDYEKRSLNGFASGHPTLKECTQLLKTLLIKQGEPCYVVIDALDESNQTQRRELLATLSAAAKESPQRVKTFITSRDEQDIVRWMKSIKDLPSLYIGAGATENAADVERYVRSEIERYISEGQLLEGNVDDGLRDMICETLIKKANGMFLWCRYQMLYLCGLEFKSEVVEALSKLPWTMDETCVFSNP